MPTGCTCRAYRSSPTRSASRRPSHTGRNRSLRRRVSARSRPPGPTCCGGSDVRRLYVLRHAKSSWADPELADHERPLAPRGRKACRRLAAWIGEHDVRPELVVCSTAARARRTVELVLRALGDPEVTFDEGVYHGWTDDLLARVRALDDTCESAMLVGHNPALQNLCLLLA